MFVEVDTAFQPHENTKKTEEAELLSCRDHLPALPCHWERVVMLIPRGRREYLDEVSKLILYACRIFDGLNELHPGMQRELIASRHQSPSEPSGS